MPTHKNEGCVQVIVVLPGIISVKLFGFSAVHGEEVCSGIVGPEGFKELLEGGMEASRLGCQHYQTTAVKWIWRTTWDQSGRPSAPAEVLLVWSPHGRTSPFVVIVERVKSLALERPKLAFNVQRSPSNIIHEQSGFTICALP